MRTSVRPSTSNAKQQQKTRKKMQHKNKQDEGQVPDRRGCIKQKITITKHSRHDDFSRQTFRIPRLVISSGNYLVSLGWGLGV
ncbi:hypothetical protein BJY01DRAFT_101745 [Aspergillus pseudoustus]|uniref:Small EDRK-rich factor-like N-terminal domain-containing protein n=1 Tax=Aspergillus pseudoustus TaxID=1810923 RepID=A0ABR4IWY7_9EURO